MTPVWLVQWSHWHHCDAHSGVIDTAVHITAESSTPQCSDANFEKISVESLTPLWYAQRSYWHHCAVQIWHLCDFWHHLREALATFKAVLWIRIRIGSGFSDFVDPDLYWEFGSGSRGKTMKKFKRKNALFSYFLNKILPLKRCKIALTTFWTKILMNNTGIIDLIWLKFWFQKNLRRKLSSKVLF
jgi:hypothetical protein